MAIEIERKFLVATQAWRRNVVRTSHVQQAYLSSGEACSVRVRIVDGRQSFLTIKSPRSGIARSEFQYAINYDDACRLMQLRQSEIIEKTRHCIENAGWLWEVDLFHGRNDGLLIAEVELDDEHAAFVRPDWIGREVTGQRRFHNSQLARHPYCEWQEKMPFVWDPAEVPPASRMQPNAGHDGALIP